MVRGGPIDQASISTFLSNGRASVSDSEKGYPIDEMIRHRVITVGIGTKDMKWDVEMIEYTYVYEAGDDSEPTMAHGYCFVAGDNALFIQHTSPKIIKSELALEMAEGLLSRHFNLDGKPHGFTIGKILKSHR